MLINNGIVSSNDLKIIQSLIPVKHSKARPKYSMQAKYITVHNTGNAGATGKQNADYVVNQNEYKSWHFTVGNNEVYQHLPITESGWHCGDGENGTGNRNSIGIEIAEVYGADRTAIKFVAELIKATGISIDKVVSHKNWSGKNCPRLILPHWDSFIEDIKKEIGDDDNTKVEYMKYKNGMTELKGNAADLVCEIVNKKIWDITEFTNCMNGTFFYPDGKGGLYSTSILYVEGKTYQDTANHYWNFGTPQSVFIVYKDNTVDLKRIKFLSELDLSKVRLAIGGVGLRNTQDPNFYYSPVSEGFKAGYNLKGEWKDFTDVLRKTNKSVLGYNKRLNKCYLLTVPNVAHGELIKIISDNSTGEAYDIAISVDGGGSSFQDFNWEYVFQGENTRRIHNILRFK
jgi:hypothetical protein